MEKKVSPQIAINTEVDMGSMYVGKHGYVTDCPIEDTEGHVYPVEKERPSTGILNKSPRVVKRKGVVIKE